MDNRGMDTDVGWINRKFRELERKIEALASARRPGAEWRASPTQVASVGFAADGTTLLDSTGDLSLNPATAAVLIAHITTGASANAVLDATTNRLSRSTSSRKYKQDVEDHDIDPAAVLKMRPRTWRDRLEVEDDPDCGRRYIGFIAEELHDLGLCEFVEYDPAGKPDAIAYDRLSVALLVLAKTEHARVNALEDAVAALTPAAPAPVVEPAAPPTTPVEGNV